jgi:hypothetical protein
MELKQRVFDILKFLDLFSPRPCLYSFVMTDSEKKLFDEKIKESKVYLEFGIGGSTIRALQKSKAIIYSVDSSLNWINYIRNYLIIKFQENRRLFIIHIDIGQTKEWGFPIDNLCIDLFQNYSSTIFNVIDVSTIDRVLIDGRFRVACTLKTILECNKNTNLEILIHDFWNRKEYHILLKYLLEVDRADTLGIFIIKEDFDRNSAIKDFEFYKHNPN